MRIRSRAISIGQLLCLACIITFTIGSITDAEARLHSIPPHEGDLPLKDDIQACDKTIREPIARALQSTKWGKFHFDCIAGVIIRVQAPLRSAIVKEWPKFMMENAKIFGVDPKDIRAGRRIGAFTRVEQLHKGVPIVPYWGGWAERIPDRRHRPCHLD